MAGSQTSVDENLLNEFLGFVPDAWLEDVYNGCDDHVADGMDTLEVALRAALKSNPLTTGKAAAGRKPPPTDLSEIGEGTDALTQALLDAHGKPGDMFHVYCMRNIFFVPSKYETALRALVEQQRASAAAGAAAGSGIAALKMYSAAEEAATDARIESAEDAILAERRRRWALSHHRKVAERRREAAEEAADGMRAIVGALEQQAGGAHSTVCPASDSPLNSPSEGGMSGSIGGLSVLLARVQILRDLSEHLSSAAGEGAAAAGSLTGKQPEPSRLSSSRKKGALSGHSAAADGSESGGANDILRRFAADQGAVGRL